MKTVTQEQAAEVIETALEKTGFAATKSKERVCGTGQLWNLAVVTEHGQRSIEIIAQPNSYYGYENSKQQELRWSKCEAVLVKAHRCAVLSGASTYGKDKTWRTPVRQDGTLNVDTLTSQIRKAYDLVVQDLAYRHKVEQREQVAEAAQEASARTLRDGLGSEEYFSPKTMWIDDGGSKLRYRYREDFDYMSGSCTIDIRKGGTVNVTIRDLTPEDALRFMTMKGGE